MAEEDVEEIVQQEPEEQETAVEEKSSPALAPEEKAEATPEEKPEPILPPDWMRDLLEARPPEQRREEQKAETKPEDEKDEETILGEAEMRRIERLLDQRLSAKDQEIAELRAQLGQYVGRDVTREVKATIGEVYRNHYATTFQNDSDFRSNESVARGADAIVQNWVKLAAMQAQQTGDTSNLEFARDPMFGELALAMAKVAAKVKGGQRGPVVPQGAEVESVATGAKTKPSSGPKSRLAHLSKEERAEAIRMGVTEDEIEEAEKIRAKYGAA